MRSSLVARAGLLAVVAASSLVWAAAPPAHAAEATYVQSGAIHVDDARATLFNPEHIAIPAIGSSGPAAPYPSTLTGPETTVPISDLDVSLIGLTHAATIQLDVLLVGPGGQQATIMSDSGVGDVPVSDATVRLDDEAATPLPALWAEPITSGTFRPGNYGNLIDGFAAPAPTDTGASALSVFDGTSAEGSWQLFVMDDQGSDTGSISGWQLHFTLGTAPYPSTLTVDGAASTVTDVDVSLDGFSSTHPDDVDLQLVGPGGQQVTLMSDVGGSRGLSGAQLRFDDEAAEALPDNEDDDELVSGSYQPTDFNVGDVYPSPAPSPGGGTDLSVFDGTSPNGVWSLYAVDDSGEDVSRIDGWSLHLTVTERAAPSGSVSIAGGATRTDSATVVLNLSASDPVPSEGGVTQMRFSNDGATFSAYQPFAPTAAWTLASGAGTRTVFAQFRDGAGNESAVASDSIDVRPADGTGPRAVTVEPRHRDEAVGPGAKVRVISSEALDQTTVTQRTVKLRVKGDKVVKAKVSYRPATSMIVLTPRRPLAYGTTYVLTVKGVHDLSGNAWDEKTARAGAQRLKVHFQTRRGALRWGGPGPFLGVTAGA